MSLEQEMIEAGSLRFQKRKETARKRKVEHTVGGVQVLFRRVLEPTLRGIEEWISEVEAGAAKKNAVSYQKLKDFDPLVLAGVTCRCILSSLSKVRGLTAMADELGTVLQDELKCQRFEEQQPGFWTRLEERLQQTTNYRYKKRVIGHHALRLGVQSEEWTLKERINIGTLLIEIFSASTGVVNILGEGKQPRKVEITNEAVGFITKKDARCELLDPVYMPVPEQPLEWTSISSGGYRSLGLSLVKLKRFQAPLHAKLAQIEMPRVVAAVNALQATPWRVNQDVFEVMDYLWGLGLARAGLPQQGKADLPVKPVDIDTNDEARREWKIKAREAYDLHARRRSRVIATASTLHMAKRMLEFPQFYYVHTLDFRGRAYPTVNGNLNPQGPDEGKGLLEFAVGVPLGEHGEDWLAIHGANSFGFDKAPLGERVLWTHDHEDKILLVAEDPITNMWWAEADAPWQFLAFCFEWARYLNEGRSFLSHLPVSIDGSCSGIQHFSAMLKDEVGGRAVNLTPSSKRSDIYLEVLEETKALLQEGGDRADALACWWLGDHGLLNRKMVKRPVMTLPYGATRYGFADQIEQELLKQLDGKPLPSDFTGAHATVRPENVKQVSIFLADVLWAAIGRVVSGASVAMNWLQALARVAAKTGKPISWVAPSGFLVEQDYRAQEKQFVDLKMFGERLRLVTLVDTEELDPIRTVNAIAPNFVHSLDAAHMCATIVRCAEDGILCLGAVHDCFTTHAGSMELMRKHTRETFVEQYSGQPALENLREQVLAQLPEELHAEVPEPPRQGPLDITKVVESDFFFA